MPRKPRPAQGLVAALTQEQLVVLDKMLFEENKTYADVLEAIQELFGVTTSETAIGAYYQKKGRERLQQSVATAAEASTVQASGVEITVVCQQPGVIRVAVRPIHD